MANGRYYLGRVIKIGYLNQARLQAAVEYAPIITVGKYQWTITDVSVSEKEGAKYIFGRLSKYSTQGHVTLVDTDTNSQVDTIAENLLIASSPFVYIPKYSGIAYMHVWNGIEEKVFPRRFKSIIDAKFDGFFVDCSIEPVSDYRAFIAKLKEIEKITQISATVSPPNPLFGRLWEKLDEYVRRRNASKVTVKEISQENEGLATKLMMLLEGIIENPQYEPEDEVDITDAAILMSADGYGKGTVMGEKDGKSVTIKTSETKKSFLHSNEPDKEELAKVVIKHFKKINTERDLSH